MLVAVRFVVEALKITNNINFLREIWSFCIAVQLARLWLLQSDQTCRGQISRPALPAVPLGFGHWGVGTALA